MKNQIQIKDKQIQMNGRPVQILSAEIHYFRLRRDEWADRLDKAVECGMNAVATYIPWFVHELLEGEVDLDGHRRDSLDLEAFIEEVEARGLYFIARPGPFVMAEIKNEGIPDWVYEKYPDVQATTWDGGKVSTRTVDYLHEGFLEEVGRWYGRVMPILAKHLYRDGGSVIAVQLDNEIGMLSWVSNCPDLSPGIVESLRLFAKAHNHDTEQSLPAGILEDRERFAAYAAAPEGEDSLAYHQLLGRFMRERFSQYVDALKHMAETYGVRDVVFAINIHGCGGGRGFTYPIGLAQLYKSFSGKPNFISGTDIYLGDLDVTKFQDLYILNAMTDAVNDNDQPLTSLEFEGGSSDYGERLSGRSDVSAVDFKARMTIAQGGRLLNYYLFNGGYNFRIDEYDREDGNGRIAITGERHGFAAPFNPEGKANYTVPRMKQSNRVLNANASWLSRMQEEHDDAVLGFIPDSFMTEYRYPAHEKRQAMVDHLDLWRARIPWESCLKGLLAANFRFAAIDLAARDPNPEQVLILPSSRYMAAGIQGRVIRHVQRGGKLLLFGILPSLDMAGRPCTELQDYLGVQAGEERFNAPHTQQAVVAKNSLADFAEVHIGVYQGFHLSDPHAADSAEVLLSPYAGDGDCGILLRHLAGAVILMTTEYNANPDFYRRLLKLLDTESAYRHDSEHGGLFLTTSREGNGGLLHHIFNLDGFEKDIKVSYQGRDLFDGSTLHLSSKEAVMLPENLQVGRIKILWSNCELIYRDDETVRFRANPFNNSILISSDSHIRTSSDLSLEQRSDGLLVSASGKWIDSYIKHQYGWDAVHKKCRKENCTCVELSLSF